MKRIATVFSLLAAASAQAATTIVIATVNNDHMITMQELTPVFEAAHPDIKVKWVTLEEGTLRSRVTADIETKGGQFDVMTIGMYETRLWGKKGWLKELTPDAAYDLPDLLPTIRSGVSIDGRLYAVPFYGEGSMLMYRKDLTDKAGIVFPERPTWHQIRDAAAKIHDPKAGVYGVCLRGKAGWGDNMALVTTVVNSFGGQWFDMDWKPQVDTPAWHAGVGFYVDLVRKYGPPGAANHSFNEILALYKKGKCGMWVDATIAASFIADPRQSKVADKVAFAQAPYGTTPKGATWLWSWSLAIPSGTTKVEAAHRFVMWATSKDYVRLVASRKGWTAVPTGTRRSTYATPQFAAAARFADAEKRAIDSADPSNATLPKSPYGGVQFAAIPEFQDIGIAVGQRISEALAGKGTVADALKQGQVAADKQMREAGYYK